MKVEHVHEGMRYTLSNDDLKTGDEVFPIADGRCLGGDDWILHGFDYRDFCSGFPDEPHIILDLNHSEYKPEEIRTNHGYGPREKYYKIIKREVQIQVAYHPFSRYEWREVSNTIKNNDNN